MAALSDVLMKENAFGTGVDATASLSDAQQHQDSMYVTMFEEMISTVLHHEIHLLSKSEIAFFNRFQQLSYNARYLLIRLSLRKANVWFRQCKLEEKYVAELGPNVLMAMTELWQNSPLVCDTSDALQDEPSHPFANSDVDASFSELLDCLSAEEIKQLAKENQVGKPGMTMKQLRQGLCKHTCTQSTLTSFLRSSANHQPSAVSGPASTSRAGLVEGRLRAQVLRVSTRCLQIDKSTREIFNRLNLIYLRCTKQADVDSLLLPCILSRSKKRQYPNYEYIRTSTVFLSRQSLLEYEEAIGVEAAVEGIDNGSNKPRAAAKGSGKEAGSKNHNVTTSDRPRVAKALRVKEIWMKHWEKWKGLVTDYADLPPRCGGLERFECGYVLTRVMSKGADALAGLEEREMEIQVVEALLCQKRWCRGKRGAWWERLALIYMNHLESTEENLHVALTLVIKGLEDPFTHTKYRPTLERRLKRLETKLKIDPADRHKCHGKQKKEEERVIEGVRIWKDESSESLKRDLRALREKSQPILEPSLDDESISKLAKRKNEADVKLARSKGKSIWAGRCEKEVTVEALAIEHYETLGYKGMHTEGRVLATLFSLLFWDVLFMAVPGSFETAYQTAPLDLWDDTFYPARATAIENRLAEIKSGGAAVILERVDGLEREKSTWCVGVKWTMFSRQDLLDIVECIGPTALSGVCQILAEDYSLGTAGVPDLFVWDIDNKTSKFVEVKGPGDTLQENQKVWIDVLLRVGMSVEVCKVYEEGDAPVKIPKATVKKTPQKRKKANALGDTDVHLPPREMSQPRSTSRQAVTVTQTDYDSDVIEIPAPAVVKRLLDEEQEFKTFDWQVGPKKKRRSDVAYKPNKIV